MLTSRGSKTEDDRSSPGLIADIGGTNARFGLVDPDGRIRETVSLKYSAFPTLESAAESYLKAIGPESRPRRGAFAIACPVVSDRVAMTNHRWAFSIAAVRERLQLERLTVLNDFAAVALAVPHLGADDLEPIGTPRYDDGMAGVPKSAFPIAVIGPGTGLGVAGLVSAAGRWIPIATEGGHITMPAVDDRESLVLERLRWTFDHVSAERVISGPGLVNLYNTLCEIEGEQSDPNITPDQVAGRALDGSDRICVEALEMFCSMLGTVAGDLCLTLGTRGGAYIAGGIIPKLGAYFPLSSFRARFEAKGRFEDYMAAIPIHVITTDLPAFTGLSDLVDGDGALL